MSVWKSLLVAGFHHGFIGQSGDESFQLITCNQTRTTDETRSEENRDNTEDRQSLVQSPFTTGGQETHRADTLMRAARMGHVVLRLHRRLESYVEARSALKQSDQLLSVGPLAPPGDYTIIYSHSC